MVKTPWYYRTLPIPKVKQRLPFSCGPNALRAIAKYYDVDCGDEDDYVKLCRTSKEGTYPNNLIRAAKKLNLNAKSYENMSVNLLKNLLTQGKPVIVAIQAYGRNELYNQLLCGHYVVAIGFTSQRIIFEDPFIRFNKRGYLYYNDFCNRWRDMTIDKVQLVHFGIAVWKKGLTTNDQTIKSLAKIK